MRDVLTAAAFVWLLMLAAGAVLNHVYAERYGSPYAAVLTAPAPEVHSDAT